VHKVHLAESIVNIKGKLKAHRIGQSIQRGKTTLANSALRAKFSFFVRGFSGSRISANLREWFEKISVRRAEQQRSEASGRAHLSWPLRAVPGSVRLVQALAELFSLFRLVRDRDGNGKISKADVSRNKRALAELPERVSRLTIVVIVTLLGFIIIVFTTLLLVYRFIGANSWMQDWTMDPCRLPRNFGRVRPLL
jgi:hypothetical protein